MNHQDELGETALSMAVFQGRPEITRALIAAGANPDLKDLEGNSARTWAERIDNETIKNL